MSRAEAKGWLRKSQQPGPLLTKSQGQFSNWFSSRGSCRPVKYTLFSHYSWTKQLHICTQSGPSSTLAFVKFAWFTSGILQMCAVFFQFLRISPSSILSLLAGSSVIEWPLSEVTKSFLIKAYISIVLFQQPRYPHHLISLSWFSLFTDRPIAAHQSIWKGKNGKRSWNDALYKKLHH